MAVWVSLLEKDFKFKVYPKQFTKRIQGNF